MRKLIAAGAFSYLLKPCDPAALVAEAEKAFEVGPAEGARTGATRR